MFIITELAADAADDDDDEDVCMFVPRTADSRYAPLPLTDESMTSESRRSDEKRLANGDLCQPSAAFRVPRKDGRNKICDYFFCKWKRQVRMWTTRNEQH